MGLFDTLLNRRSNTDEPKAARSPAPLAVAIPDGAQTVPRYPSPGLAVPAVPAAALIESQEDLVAQLAQTLGITRAERALWLDPVLERYAAYVHLLPASETHHHCGIGGLLRHGLEVAFYAARFTEGIVFGMDLPPALRQHYAPRARLTAALAGLLHDIGKPMVDIGAVDPVSGDLWNPHIQSLSEWLTTRKLQHYTLFWHPGARHRRHEAFAAALVHTIIGRETLAYMTQGDARGLLDVLFMAISNAPDLRHPIAEAVKRGDTASVAQDLERQSAQSTQAAGGSVRALAVRVLHALQVSIREGEWVPNTPGQPVWCTTQGVFLTYPDALLSAIQTIQREGRFPVPAAPDVLAQALRDARYIIPYDASAGLGDVDTWPVTIDVSSGKQSRTLEIRALRLDRSDVLFGNDPEPQPLPAAIGDGATLPDTTVPAIDGSPIAAPASPETPADPPVTASGEALNAPVPTAEIPPAGGTSQAEDPVIRNRREETDRADRKLQARAAPKAGPETIEQAVAWLDARPPAGEFIKTMMARKGIAPMIHRDGSSIYVAFPGPFEGLGITVGRLTEMLMQNRWVMPDAATQDRATVSAIISGRPQLAVRFTPEVSRVLDFLVPVAAQAGQANANPSSEAQRVAALGVTRIDTPIDSRERADQRKRGFFDRISLWHKGEGFCFKDMPEDVVRQDVERYAAETKILLDELISDLRATPNPMINAASMAPERIFRRDHATGALTGASKPAAPKNKARAT